MSSWKRIYVAADSPIKSVIATLDSTITQIVLVVDENEKLLGTVTDGDIRRGILRDVDLEMPVESVMRNNPVIGRPDHSPDELKHIMLMQKVRQLPIVDSQGHVVGLSLLDEMIKGEPVARRPNHVVLMAGGLGTRLQPLTDRTPKPLLEVGSKPILERIIEQLIAYNFETFHISVNFKADMVMDYFGDGSRLGVSISYLEETTRLGTAGSLGLIPERPTESLLVMNADVLTANNFDSLMQFHAEQDVKATMCVRNYEFQVPFGVVTTEDLAIKSIDEKPSQNFLVNAGIYVLEPDVLDVIQPNEKIDMTEIFMRTIAAGGRSSVFPIREYWLDVGRMDDLAKAQQKFMDD